MPDKSIQDVYNEFTTEQKKVVHFMLGALLAQEVEVARMLADNRMFLAPMED